MQFTTNYDLSKPDLTDKFEVEHQNQNMDIIDGEMKNLDDATSFLATNLITNGNFANGLAGWLTSGVTTVSNNVAKCKVSSIYGGLKQYTSIINHKYYARADIKATSPNIKFLMRGVGLVSHSGSGEFESMSIIGLTVDSNTKFFAIEDWSVSGWTDFYVKNCILVDLTSTFGAGNEPTQAQCDLMFATWKDATFQVSTIESLENNKANRVQEAWITPTLVNSWVPFDSATYDTFKYMKDEMGFVHLRGMVKSGTTGVICTLPVGYRPLKTVVNPCISNNVIGRVDISAVGVVTCIVYNNTYVSLQGISFKAEQ